MFWSFLQLAQLLWDPSSTFLCSLPLCIHQGIFVLPVFLSVRHSIGAWSLTSSNIPKGNLFSFCLTSQKLARDHQLKQEVSWTPPFFMFGFSQAWSYTSLIHDIKIAVSSYVQCPVMFGRQCYLPLILMCVLHPQL